MRLAWALASLVLQSAAMLCGPAAWCPTPIAAEVGLRPAPGRSGVRLGQWALRSPVNQATAAPRCGSPGEPAPPRPASKTYRRRGHREPEPTWPASPPAIRQRWHRSIRSRRLNTTPVVIPRQWQWPVPLVMGSGGSSPRMIRCRFQRRSARGLSAQQSHSRKSAARWRLRTGSFSAPDRPAQRSPGAFVVGDSNADGAPDVKRLRSRRRERFTSLRQRPGASLAAGVNLCQAPAQRRYWRLATSTKMVP